VCRVNAKELLIEALQKAGFNGLGHDLDCCCLIEDLIPCREDPSKCEPCNLTLIKPELNEVSDDWDDDNYIFDYKPKEITK
jgi:hypothetical protein